MAGTALCLAASWAYSKPVGIQDPYTCAFAVGVVFARASLFEAFAAAFPGACTRKVALPALLAVWAARVLLPHLLPLGLRVDVPLAAPLVWSLVVLLGSMRGRLSGALRLLGKHSTAMWLTHSLVTVYYFPQVAVLPRFPLLVFVWCVVLSLGAAVAVDWAYARLCAAWGSLWNRLRRA